MALPTPRMRRNNKSTLLQSYLDKVSCSPIPMFSCHMFPFPHSPILLDGTSQYISLPADPRVLSGEYSYAVLQQPDGSSQIVLMENSTIS